MAQETFNLATTIVAGIKITSEEALEREVNRVITAVYDDLQTKVDADAGDVPPTDSAAVARDQAIAARDAAVAAAAQVGAVPDPFFLLWGGQSNAKGSDGGSGTNWPTEAGLVFVWNPATLAWADVTTMQGVDPFNLDDSNNAGVHHAMGIAKSLGVTVYMVCSTEGGTEIEQWTGGGYANGIPIVTDRTISDTNRIQFKKITDAVAAATSPAITEFHAASWFQGESDSDTPPTVYLAELEYLMGEIKAQGTAPDADRIMPVTIYGVYAEPDASTQRTRITSLERIVRENPGTFAYVPTHDLDPVPGALLNHFDSDSLKIAGERGARASISVLRGSDVLTDHRVEDVMLAPLVAPVNGRWLGQQMGNRSHKVRELADGESYTLDIAAGRDAHDEMYYLSGATSLALDEAVNSLANDDGRRFHFYQIVASDAVTLTCTDRPMYFMMGDQGVTSLTITGRGKGTVEVRNNRYMVSWEPQYAHTDNTIATGTATEKQMVSPAQMRVAGVAAAQSLQSVRKVTTDAGANILAGTTALIHSGTLTATRVVTLHNTGRVDGDTFEARRTGGGAFDLSFRNHDATPLQALSAADQWLKCVFDGTDWLLVAAG